MAEELIKKLKFKRASYKGQLTRLNTFFENLGTEHVQECTLLQLEAKLSKTKPVYDQFSEVQLEIEVLADQEDVEERVNFDDLYFSIIAKVESYLKNTCSNFNPPAAISESGSSSGTQGLSQGNSLKVKLPTIQLPAFNGKFQEWLSFRDLFIALVHQNVALSEVQKLHYLKTSLQGRAGDILSSLELTNSNYLIGWNLLLERFENKRLIIQNHVAAIFDLEQVKRESHNNLRTMLDNVNKNLRALESLGEPTNQWGTLLIHIICSKLDSNTKRLWHEFQTENEVPNMDDFTIFLKKRCEILESMNANHTVSQDSNGKMKSYGKYNVNTALQGDNSKTKCKYCKEPHQIYYCPEFLKLPIKRRHEETGKLNLCYNCFKYGHGVNACRSAKCFKCGRKHNSLLHDDSLQIKAKNIESHEQTSTQSGSKVANVPIDTAMESTVISHVMQNKSTVSYVLLSTAMVILHGPNNRIIRVKALLDSGSQTSVITDKIVKMLGLHTERCDSNITGINQSKSNVNLKTELTMSNLNCDFSMMVSCIVLPHITARLPKINLHTPLRVPQGLTLADPSFADGGEIQLLLGGECFWNLVGQKRIVMDNEDALLFETKLGYILAGTIQMSQSANTVLINTCSSSNTNLNKQLERFWNVEHLEDNNGKQNFTIEEQRCEDHFVNTHKRDPSGRFIVSMPFNEKLPLLGESRDFALNRFLSIERRLNADAILKQKYAKFINDYISLGHMSEVTDNEIIKPIYYLSHHPVFKQNDINQKIRVVFDGSMKTTSGISLNNTQRVGPTIQRDLFSILISFRQHKYVLIGDITSMYRCVLMNSNHRQFQRIFWRNDKTEKIKEYNLNTVTYGQAASPFLAIRCLHELALENKTLYPRTANIITTCFYVDDLICGSDKVDDLIAIKNEITHILNSGGFPIGKWMSNELKLLENDKMKDSIQLGEKQQSKTLGVAWNAITDNLHYSVNITSLPTQNSKRAILSTISKFFDPLGYLGPVIIIGKIIMQKLWLNKSSWDETIPTELESSWNEYKGQLSLINEIKIPRLVIAPQSIAVELHAFSDASESAYGGVLYIRCALSDGTFVTNFLCAKSRVSPVKTLSLPRLELCGALLVTKLANKVKPTLDVTFCQEYFWTDSTVTLHWIKNTKTQWKTFVANRVSIIQTLTNVDNWNHIKSENNPADIISRGMSVRELQNSNLWQHGPNFLKEPEHRWPQSQIKFENMEQLEVKRVTVTISEVSNFDLFNKYSNLKTLTSVMAYIQRFIYNLKNKNNRRVGDLTKYDITMSSNTLIKMVQNNSFAGEIRDLQSRGHVSNSSTLRTLNPFIDDEGLIRVGGRLVNSNLNFDKKHPILLPHTHRFTNLVIENEHKRLLHCGAQSLLASLREKYWPIAARNLIRKITHGCKICFKVKPKAFEYTMGNLPIVRMTPCKPFLNSCTDFAGPFQVKDRVTRGYKLVKMYICIFICMSTKATHLELVTDLTTDAFMATLKRFIARRGKCLNIYSDNGTNYVGANRTLQEIYQFLKTNKTAINSNLLKDQIQWHWSPPKSPNFNGIAESGVRAVKGHLKKIVGELKLTESEFLTVLTQIEACLNSRPISQLSSDPNDLTPLTPGHFLVGGPLMAIPEQNYTHTKDNALSKWQRVQKIVQHFWQRWTTEYLHQLQQRYKWNHSNPPTPNIGDLVLLKDDNLPTLLWNLGRIVQQFPGADGIVRVVEVQTVRGLFKRAVTKLCPLPND